LQTRRPTPPTMRPRAGKSPPGRQPIR